MDNPEALTETEKTKKEKPQHRTPYVVELVMIQSYNR
jgi:hypothetical protein